MKLLLLGSPGSGKGTISNELILNFNFKHISTGNLFRDIIKKESKLATNLKKYLYKGELVPDELTNEVLKESLMENMNENLVFDGYPRNVDQAKFLSHICELDLVLLLEVDDDIIIKRTLGRRICPTCGNIYNVHSSFLENKNLCNKDGSILIQRKDDNLETIKNRIKIYHENSQNLISFYNDKKFFYRLNSNKDINLVFLEIKKILKELKNDFN